MNPAVLRDLIYKTKEDIAAMRENVAYLGEQEHVLERLTDLIERRIPRYHKIVRIEQPTEEEITRTLGVSRFLFGQEGGDYSEQIRELGGKIGRGVEIKIDAELFSNNVIAIVNMGKDSFKQQTDDGTNKEIFDKIFNKDAEEDLPVVIVYRSSRATAHAVLLMRKITPEGIKIEFFDPDAIPENRRNLIEKDIISFIRTKSSELDWKLEEARVALQGEDGIQCLRMCWMRWNTYKNGYDGKGAELFQDLDGFITFFDETFKDKRKVEMIAASMLMTEGKEVAVMREMLELKKQDIDELTKKVKWAEEELGQYETELAAQHDIAEEIVAEDPEADKTATKVVPALRRNAIHKEPPKPRELIDKITPFLTEKETADWFAGEMSDEQAEALAANMRRPEEKEEPPAPAPAHGGAGAAPAPDSKKPPALVKKPIIHKSLVNSPYNKDPRPSKSGGGKAKAGAGEGTGDKA